MIHGNVLSGKQMSGYGHGAGIVMNYKASRYLVLNNQIRASALAMNVLECSLNMKPHIMYCAPPGKAFAMRENAVLQFRLLLRENDMSVRLIQKSPDMPLGQPYPIETLSSVVSQIGHFDTREALYLNIERVLLDGNEEMRVWHSPEP